MFRNSNTEQSEGLDLSKPHVSRAQIQEILGGMRPKKLENYRRALVHKSVKKYVAYELDKKDGQVCSYFIESGLPTSNERLEFLGDAVFNLIVGEYIFDKYPDKDEGFLTRLRTKIVRDTHCVKFAELIGLGPYILTGPIVKRDPVTGKYNDKLLEDAFEAFLGAIRKDLGYTFAEGFVIKLIEKYVDFDKLLEDDNYKDILMRYLQNKGVSLPVYNVTSQHGPPHKCIFTVQITVNIDGMDMTLGVGKGCSKKEAEQSAALASLTMIDEDDLGDISKRDEK